MSPSRSAWPLFATAILLLPPAKVSARDLLRFPDGIALRFAAHLGRLRACDERTLRVVVTLSDSAVLRGEAALHATQRFWPAPGEGIYGLGQYERGVMNYRNSRETLIVNKRHVVVFLLVSSRRYGIYWDKYSHAEFPDGPGG